MRPGTHRFLVHGRWQKNISCSQCFNAGNSLQAGRAVSGRVEDCYRRGQHHAAVLQFSCGTLQRADNSFGLQQTCTCKVPYVCGSRQADLWNFPATALGNPLGRDCCPLRATGWHGQPRTLLSRPNPRGPQPALPYCLTCALVDIKEDTVNACKALSRGKRCPIYATHRLCNQGEGCTAIGQ